jgi:hypothetical protein
MSPLLDSASADSQLACGNALSVPTSRADSETEMDTGLQRVIDAWPDISAAIKAGILAMIESTQ